MNFRLLLIRYLCVLLVVLGLAGSTAAAPKPTLSTRSLADFLLADGTLRPDASGSFNAIGYRVETDPVTGQPTFRPSGINDEKWSEQFGAAMPLAGAVNAIAVAGNGDIFVGGAFVDAGGNANADRVARWDGNRWQALGTGIGNGTVSTLALAGNGDLLVGGSFSAVSGIAAARGVVRWDGTAWQALGSGISGAVRALAVTGTGTVVVGGAFSNAGGNPNANYIAAWTGTAWQSFGSGLTNNVNALAVATNNDILVGGRFLNAGGNASADCIARWNGSSWQALGAGLDNGLTGTYTPEVNAIAIAANASIYVGGNALMGSGLAVWDGTAWSMQGNIYGTVSAVKFTSNGDLYIGGNFVRAGNVTGLNNAAKYNYLGWQSVGFIPSNPVATLATTYDGNMLLGGAFTDAGTNVNADYLTKLVGARPLPLSQGLNGTVNAIYVVGSGNVYVGGSFTDAGGNPNADRIAVWNGTYWDALGTGISNGAVKCIDNSKGTLVVGGTFTGIGSNIYANRVGYWDGAAWQALGSTGVSNGSVEAVEMAGNSIANGVYVGGSFTGVGNSLTGNRIVKMTATTCVSLGNGIGQGTVYAIGVAFNGSVVVGGSFYSVNNNFNMQGVALWNGTAWSAMGQGISGTVYDVDVFGTGTNDVWVCGDFSGAVAHWVSGWGTVPGISNGIAYSIETNTTGFVVAGTFTDVGGIAEADYVVRRSGTTWQALGTGLNGPVYGLGSYYTTNAVFAGGAFTTVGDASKDSNRFGLHSFAAANTPPTIAAQQFSIDENAPNGRVVGTVVASDPDAGQTLTYSIVAGGGAFSLAGNQLVVANQALLNYGATPVFTLLVRVTDNGTPARTNAAAITINLRDITPPTATISSTFSNPTTASPITVAVVFSETVTGFVATSPTVTNGTVNNFTGSGTTYAFTITPTVPGAVTAFIAANAARDAAGNGNIATALFSIQYALPSGTLAASAGRKSTELYPNPANVAVTLVSAIRQEAVICNSLGQVVRRQGISAGNSGLLTADLPVGIYYVQTGQDIPIKLVVVH